MARAGVNDVELQMGRSGQFDITIDGKLAYSRAQSRGFPSDAEVDALAKSD